MKWFYPEVFAAALLNSQPMGFYAPAQLVRDAREHEVGRPEAELDHLFVGQGEDDEDGHQRKGEQDAHGIRPRLVRCGPEWRGCAGHD